MNLREAFRFDFFAFRRFDRHSDIKNILVERSDVHNIRKFVSLARRNVPAELTDSRNSVFSINGVKIDRKFASVAVNVVSKIIYGIHALSRGNEFTVFNAYVACVRRVLFISDDVVGKSSYAVIVLNGHFGNDNFLSGRYFILFLEIVRLENRA